jgi:hypothetical protein
MSDVLGATHTLYYMLIYYDIWWINRIIIK